jgi:hypothetical protein
LSLFPVCSSRRASSGLGKSSTCFATTGGPLTEYRNKAEAESAARYVAGRYGSKLTPYHCGRCYRWHLGQRRAARPLAFAQSCSCIGADGKQKQAYRSRGDAEMRAQMGMGLGYAENVVAYKCPSGAGWHLRRRLTASWAETQH